MIFVFSVSHFYFTQTNLFCYCCRNLNTFWETNKNWMIKNVLFCVSEPESPRTSHQVPQGSTSGSSRNGFVRRNLPGNQEHKRTGKGLEQLQFFTIICLKLGLLNQFVQLQWGLVIRNSTRTAMKFRIEDVWRTNHKLWSLVIRNSEQTKPYCIIYYTVEQFERIISLHGTIELQFNLIHS